jgi:hypothetical protein
MAEWLDMLFVGAAVLAACFLAYRMYRRGKAAACARACGACEPAAPKDALVQIGGKSDRAFLAGSRANR